MLINIIFLNIEDALTVLGHVVLSLFLVTFSMS